MALLTFECGAQVLVKAPAVVIPDHAMGCSIEWGGASVQAPTQAIGLTLAMRIARITDLGTGRSCPLAKRVGIRAPRLDWTVEVSLDQRFERARDVPLTICEGKSIGFDAPEGNIRTLRFGQSLRQPFR